MLKKSDKEKISKEIAHMLLEIGAVSFSFNPPYTFTSGLKGPMYFDNRISLSHPKVRSKIIDYYIKVIKAEVGLKNFDYISATATAAIPQGALVADRLNLPLVYVRPSTKSYGKGQKLEGYLEKGSEVLIVEDHISTAASAINNVKTIKELGGGVKFCITCTTLEQKKAKELVQENDITLIPLTTGKVIIEEGLNKGYVSRAERDIVFSWFDDPENWESKHKLRK